MYSPKKDDQETESSYKTRKPRWSREESLVVIEGTHMVESLWSKNNGGIKSKWEYVSSFCNEHGVKRGPDHCRKRWGSLLIDFKKIKKWESLLFISDGIECESFWTLTSVQRKEKMLPCYFDKEIYNLLEMNLCVKPINQVRMEAGEEIDEDYEQGMGMEELLGKRKRGFDDEEEESCRERKFSKKGDEEMMNIDNSEIVAAINRIGDACLRIADKLQLKLQVRVNHDL